MTRERKLLIVFAVSNAVWTALIFMIGGPLSALAVGWQLNRANRAAKEEDYKRQDEVARLAAEAASDLAVANKKVADEAARQQAEVAETASQAAHLLLEAQQATLRGTDEVARLAAEKPGAGGGSGSRAYASRLLAVIVSYPNGNRQEVLLSAVPRIGDHLRIADFDVTAPSLVIEHVLWMEGGSPGMEPSVIIVVRPRVGDHPIIDDALKAVLPVGQPAP